MTTFDAILEQISIVFTSQADNLQKIVPLLINRDLNGRVRLILEERLCRDDEAKLALDAISCALAEALGKHSFSADRIVLFEESLNAAKQGAPCFALEGFNGVSVVDRLATETDWGHIAPIASGAARIVFYSLKGGVGRSTALAVTAWTLAQQGKKVMVLDLDLESPGISSALLPGERRPPYGITDWLVEDLVDNGDTVLNDMVAISDLSHDGEIYVVPAHGAAPGEYIAKLGRVWMPKSTNEGRREAWPLRLNRLLQKLEEKHQPDVLLIDARSGIDEIASACINSIGAKAVLLFAIEGEQTWSGYKILFQHWLNTGQATTIRDRIQILGVMAPDDDLHDYFESLCEQSWNLFTDTLYDEVPAEAAPANYFNFDKGDESAPHFPWLIRWSRSFFALKSIRAQHFDSDQLKATFGPLLEGIVVLAEQQGEKQ